MIIELKKFTEETAKLSILLGNSELINFGFTDIAIVEIAKEKKKDRWTVLTDEFRMYQRFNEEIPIIYFKSIKANEEVKNK